MSACVDWTPVRAEVEQRRARLTVCRADTAKQAIAVQACRADVALWVRDWVWTYDPRLDDPIVPLVPWPRQGEYLAWRTERFANRERGLVEKSRDMGITWLNVAWQVHQWLFFGGYKGAFGSRKLDLVDRKADPDCIFERIRFVVRWLPVWMRPAGFSEDKHAPFCRLLNPANGSIITGEGGSQIGRGGRSTVYDLDESAFLEQPERVERSLSQNTDVLIETSTPNGLGNPFEQRRSGGKIAVFSFHWRDDPRKNDAWYAKQCADLDPVTIAQELDLDYAASQRGVLIPATLVNPCVGRDLYAKEPGAICIGGDIGEDGSDFSAAVVREGRNIPHAEEWRGCDPTESGNKFVSLGLVFETRLEAHHKLFFFIDRIGIGSGVCSHLRAWIKANGRVDKWVVVAVNVGEKSPEPLCFRRRDALWWRMGRWYADNAPAISRDIPADVARKLARECSTPTHAPNENGLIVVESKKLMYKRGVVSPNLADALMHTFLREAMKPAAPDKMRDWDDEGDGRFKP